MKTLANTTILSNLAAVGRLDLLEQLHGRLYIPSQVYEEILSGLEEGYVFYDGIESQLSPFAEDGWLELVSLHDREELALFQSLARRLHLGEAACLAIAQHRGWAFLTDDKQARKAARDLGVLLSGTLGALVQAVKRDLLTLESGNRLLGEMIARGYHAPYASLDSLVDRD
jgi:predicted nucleic acid-binding protein